MRLRRLLHQRISLLANAVHVCDVKEYAEKNERQRRRELVPSIVYREHKYCSREPNQPNQYGFEERDICKTHNPASLTPRKNRMAYRPFSLVTTPWRRETIPHKSVIEGSHIWGLNRLRLIWMIRKRGILWKQGTHMMLAGTSLSGLGGRGSC